MQRVYRRGFLMVELGLAFALLSLFFSLLGVWYVSGIQNQSEALKRWRVMQAIRTLVDQWRAQSSFTDSGQKLLDEVNLSWESQADKRVSSYRFIKITGFYQGVELISYTGLQL